MTTSRMTVEPPTITPPNAGSAKRDRTRAQAWAESALVQHPYHLELRGAPNDLSWPRVCAYCGHAAMEQIVVKKAFRPRPRRTGRGSGSPWMKPYRITGAPIPFCGECAAEHRATVQSPSMAKKILTVIGTPLIIPAVGSAWMATVVLSSVRGMPLTDRGGLLGWGLFALMLATSAWSVFLMWQTTRASRLDPQTEITRACDFSEDVSHFFEKERRIYALRNKEFAEAMATLNTGRAWTADDQARSKRNGMIVAVLTLLVFGGIAALLSVTGR
jgi:hypothetical protein